MVVHVIVQAVMVVRIIGSFLDGRRAWDAPSVKRVFQDGCVVAGPTLLVQGVEAAMTLKRFETLEKVQNLLDPLVGRGVDLRGHFKRGKGWGASEDALKKFVLDSLMFLGVEDLQGILNALKTLKPFTLKNRGNPCSYCGAPMGLCFNGENLVWDGEECPHRDGLITEFELNVPSGRIVVDDDLRQWFPVDEDFDVNTQLGRHLTSLAAAQVGLAHGFVGNSCPRIFQKESKFVIGNYEDVLWDEGLGDYVDNPEECGWGEVVATICTDLWWYSIADFDDFVRRMAHYTPKISLDDILNHPTIQVVDVKPGVYKFRQEQGISRSSPIVAHATFEWVRDPDPVRDLLQEDIEKHANATEILIQRHLSWAQAVRRCSPEEAIQHWNEATQEAKLRMLASAASDIMFSSRADEWHENGFPRATLSEEIRRLAKAFGEVPAFAFRYSWGSIYKDFSAICLGAGMGKSSFGPFPKLERSFVLLALNICQSALVYGDQPRLNREVYPPAYEVVFVRRGMKMFKATYRAYRKMYPDIVFDEAFDAWQATEIDAHIENFDFGVQDPPREEWGEPPPTMKSGQYFEFDASKIGPEGSFCWARGGWAAKEHAERYALGVLEGSMSPMGHLHIDGSARAKSMIPLKATGRVLRGTGEGHASAHLVVTFDYGSEFMRGEMAFSESDMKGVEQFDDPERYAALLEKYSSRFTLPEDAPASSPR